VGEGGGVKPHAFLTSTPERGGWSRARLCLFIVGEITDGTRLLGGWVGPGADVDMVVKIRMLPIGDRTLVGLLTD
jgi:hypothetical protein